MIRSARLNYSSFFFGHFLKTAFLAKMLCQLSASGDSISLLSRGAVAVRLESVSFWRSQMISLHDDDDDVSAVNGGK